ncbi:MAG TPA: hypothetical protein VGC13_28815 [Longimicrobium sp.]|jgi:hypothetical protein|uniref:hypothetical protein n=1 Tax=Longimicrobium sp. TaxID=2029185 RepID=UPI002ED88197
MPLTHRTGRATAPSMHIGEPTRTRARRAALAAVLCASILSAACGGSQADAAAPAGGTAASADTSAMAIARRALGQDVGMAIPFRTPHGDAGFVAAAIPIPGWVPDQAEPGKHVEPGGYEIVVVESTPGADAVRRPGLYTSRLPWLERWHDTTGYPRLDSAAIGRMSGVEDANGDGTPEVWAVQFFRGTKGYAWRVRAYDLDARGVYEGMLGSVWAGEGLDSASFAFNRQAEQNPHMRQWVLRRGRQLDSVYVDGRRRERAAEGMPDSVLPGAAEPRP